jgi:NAD(P)-dependent dehydrogenase (short-subunit alcohol dehydrogenase family)
VTDNDDGRVWLVTGCSTGIGRAVAQRLVARGTRLVAAARRPETVGDLTDAGGGRVVTARLDLSDTASIGPAVDAGLSGFGRIDVLLSCAGTGLVGSIEESSEEEIDRVFGVNFFGTLALVRAVLPVMRQQGRGARGGGLRSERLRATMGLASTLPASSRRTVCARPVGS